MSSYPTGGVGQYHGDNQQHETFHDPPQFDPYNTHRPQDSYDHNAFQEPYQDEPSYPVPQTQSVKPLGQTTKEDDSPSPDEFNPTPREPSTRNLRAWRYQQGRPLWVRGSRPRCICRFFFCTVFITLFLLIAIVLSLALWIQPPNVIIGDCLKSPVVAQGVTSLNDGIQVNLGLPVEVDNPNYFSARITHVNADIFYPINNTRIGNGKLTNVNLPSRATTKFTFPFTLDYTESIDPNRLIIDDLANKCGAKQQDLTVNYKLTVGVKVFFITVSPTISNPISFVCPISASTLQVSFPMSSAICFVRSLRTFFLTRVY
ncbi:hypothetical protein BJV78DRAFT_1117445 [Lactifluus subvellereus]|nr:hypothetical protein BJV78DRAFT_1117445 [Lactifluus subvellereus]